MDFELVQLFCDLVRDTVGSFFSFAGSNQCHIVKVQDDKNLDGGDNHTIVYDTIYLCVGGTLYRTPHTNQAVLNTDHQTHKVFLFHNM